MVKNKYASIRKNPVPISSSHIPPAAVPPDEFLKLSFKHLDLLGNEKFSLKLCGKGYLDKFLNRLKDVCGISVSDFRANKSKSLRSHRISWAETSEKQGFMSLNSQLRASEAWQFEITANEHGRVHGILLDNVFYLVWIDPCHKLYS